jgi:hypothetical protein
MLPDRDWQKVKWYTIAMALAILAIAVIALIHR